MTAILGISAFYHDSAAALIADGDIVAAAQEERFSRKKHDAGYPVSAFACRRSTEPRASFATALSPSRSRDVSSLPTR